MVVYYSSAFLNEYRLLPRGAQQDLQAIIDELRAGDLSSLTQANGVHRIWLAPGAVAFGEVVRDRPGEADFQWIGIADPSGPSGIP